MKNLLNCFLYLITVFKIQQLKTVLVFQLVKNSILGLLKKKLPNANSLLFL